MKHHDISGEEKLITKIKGEILNKSNLIRFIYVFKLLPKYISELKLKFGLDRIKISIACSFIRLFDRSLEHFKVKSLLFIILFS